MSVCRLLINAVTGKVSPGTQVTSNPTNQDLASIMEPESITLLWASSLWEAYRCLGLDEVSCQCKAADVDKFRVVRFSQTKRCLHLSATIENRKPALL